MPRYFIEVAYKGTAYSGFQIQQNANTIQAEVEKALAVVFKRKFELTGSSRTDAGVHALQNYFHFDSNEGIQDAGKRIYNLNAVLPSDIVVKNLFQVAENTHCRFDAISREYRYYIYRRKNPFKSETAYFYPYNVNLENLNKAATGLTQFHDFTTFSKRNTQVNNFTCTIYKSEWKIENDMLVYQVIANRFLRGMVKGFVGTMLRVGTGKISLEKFEEIVLLKDCSRADFSVPSRGLFLVQVNYPEGLFA